MGSERSFHPGTLAGPLLNVALMFIRQFRRPGQRQGPGVWRRSRLL